MRWSLWILPLVAFGQAGTEPATLATSSRYLWEWLPQPPQDSGPEWARPGRIRFSRWDGGPIETAKALLSGWPGFNPPIPDYLFVMTNWYRPETIRLLREAHINLIWVTFSNGFSMPVMPRGFLSLDRAGRQYFAPRPRPHTAKPRKALLAIEYSE